MRQVRGEVVQAVAQRLEPVRGVAERGPVGPVVGVDELVLELVQAILEHLDEVVDVLVGKVDMAHGTSCRSPSVGAPRSSYGVPDEPFGR